MLNSSKRRKLEITAAAKELFLDQGYFQTTVADILASTGLSKGGFYHHFKSKEEVLVTIIDQIVEEVVEEAYVIAADTRLDPVEKIRSFIKMNFEKKLSEASLLSALAKGKENKLVLYKYYTRVWEQYLPPLVQIVEEGIAYGSMAVDFPEETVRLLYQTFTLIHELEPDLIKDEKELFKLLQAMEQMVVRSLGMDEEIKIGFAAPEFAARLWESRN